MSIQPQESRVLKNSSEAVVTQQSLKPKTWSFEIVIKLISYIFYGFFFGLIPASFYFSKFTTPSEYPIEMNSVIGLFGVAILSIALIFWLNKGDIRKFMPINYYVLHLFNAVLLIVGLLVTCWFPINATSDYNENIIKRQFILMLSSIGWAIVMSIVILVSFIRIKKLFPLSWTKIWYTWLILVCCSLLSVFFFLAANARKELLSDSEKVFQVVALCTYVLAFILFVLGITYIKVYRDVLLSERTDYEIEAINDWSNAKILALISACAAGITFLIALCLGSNADLKLELTTYIEIAIDAFLVVVYFTLVLISKINENKDVRKSKFVKLFKSIDSILLLESFVWIILVKAACIQGAIISDNGDASSKSLLYLVTIISFISTALLYIISTVFAVQIPNLKNTIISISVIIGAILVESIVISFVIEYSKVFEDQPVFLPLYMTLAIVLGVSVALMVRILTISKIFKAQLKYEIENKAIKDNEIEQFDYLENNDEENDGNENYWSKEQNNESVKI